MTEPCTTCGAAAEGVTLEQVEELIAEAIVSDPGNIPAGGTTGQVLAKDSDVSLDVGWADVGGGVTAQAGRPAVDAGQNQYFWFTKSRGDVDAGTYKIVFAGLGSTAAINIATDYGNQGADGLNAKLAAVLGTKDTDWQWFAGSGSGGYPYEGQFGVQLIGAHANTQVTATITDSTLSHNGTPGDTIEVVQWFGGRPVNAAADTAAAGGLVLDTVEHRLWVASQANTWQQVATFPYADTPPIRLSSSDPPNDTNLENNWSWGVIPPWYQRRGGLLFVSGSVSACAYDGSSPATGNNIATLPVGFRPEQDWHTMCFVSGCQTIDTILMGWDAPDPTNYTAGSQGGGIFPVLPAYAPGNPTYLDLIADKVSDKAPTIWLALQGVPIDTTVWST